MRIGKTATRVLVGGLFIGHSTQKLFGWFGGDPAATAEGFEKMGLRRGRRHAMAAGAADMAVSTVFADGGQGGLELARMVIAAAETGHTSPAFLYALDASIKQKIHAIATEIYGAADVSFSEQAEQQIGVYEAKGFGNLPICMAKTHLSLSHDPALKGAPSGYTFPIREVRASVGAGFIYPLAGTMVTMPGLGTTPAAQSIDIDADGNTVGLF